MKNLSNTETIRYINRHIHIIRSSFLILSILLVSKVSGQQVCDDYEKNKFTLEKTPSEEVQKILSGLVIESYWDEWYDLILKNCRTLGKNAHWEIVEYLKKQGNEIVITDQLVKGKYFYLLAYAHKRAGDLYHALENLKVAYDVFSKIKNQPNTLRSLKGLSHFHSLFNDHYNAIDYGELYLNELPVTDKRNRRIAYSNLAEYCYHANQLDQAIAHLDSALHYEPDFLPIKLMTEIRIELARNNYARALKLIQHCKVEYSNQDDYRNEINKQEAHYYSKINDHERAIAIRKYILEQPSDDGRQRERNKTFHLLAENYFETGQYELALESTHRLQNYFALDFETDDIYAVPDSIQLIPEAWLMESLFLKAKIFEKLWTGERDKDKLILSTYEKAMYVLDQLRHQYSLSGSVFNISEVDYIIFDRAISFCRDRYEATNDVHFYDKALIYSQIAKSFALKQSRSVRTVLKTSGIDEKIIQGYLHFASSEAKDLKEKKVYLDSLRYYEQKILEENQDFNTSIKINSLTSKNVKENIADSTALLHFFIGSSHIHCFTISPKGQFWMEEQIPENMEQMMFSYDRSLTDVEYILKDSKLAEQEYLENASLLYSKLMQPQMDFLDKNEIRSLLIVADDFIHQISIEALPMLKNESWTNENIYFINKFKISHLYLTSEILDSDFANAVKIENGISFGNNYEHYPGTPKQFSVLKNAVSEADEIAQLTHIDESMNSDVQLEEIKHSIQNLDILHYSGHAVYDSLDFSKSYLPVYEGKKDAEFTYNMLVATTSKLKFACLSACNTTNGQNVRTEGLISLSRAMIENQTSSCLGSLWNASDIVSKNILVDFYRNLIRGNAKPASLQQAQLNHLNDPQVRAIHKIPLYWSNWKLYGHTSPLNFPKKNWIYYPILGISLLVILLFFKKNKKSPLTRSRFHSS